MTLATPAAGAACPSLCGGPSGRPPMSPVRRSASSIPCKPALAAQTGASASGIEICSTHRRRPPRRQLAQSEVGCAPLSAPAPATPCSGGGLRNAPRHWTPAGCSGQHDGPPGVRRPSTLDSVHPVKCFFLGMAQRWSAPALSPVSAVPAPRARRSVEDACCLPRRSGSRQEGPIW